MRAAEIIAQTIGGRNFVTPDVLEFGFTPSGKYAYELSWAPNMSPLYDKPVYGVTLALADGSPRTFDEPSDMFYDEAEARAHIAKL
jgi:hypothetical protein